MEQYIASSNTSNTSGRSKQTTTYVNYDTQHKPETKTDSNIYRKPKQKCMSTMTYNINWKPKQTKTYVNHDN